MSFLAVIFWPDFGFAQRIGAMGAAVLISAMVYGATYSITMVVSNFSSKLIKPVGYFYFYGGVLNIVLIPALLLLGELNSPSGPEIGVIEFWFLYPAFSVMSSAGAYLALSKLRVAA